MGQRHPAQREVKGQEKPPWPRAVVLGSKRTSILFQHLQDLN